MQTDQLKEAFAKDRDDNQQILSLIAGYNRSTLTDDERDKLDDWITSDDFNEVLFVMLTDKKSIPVLREILKSLSLGSNSL